MRSRAQRPHDVEIPEHAPDRAPAAPWTPAAGPGSDVGNQATVRLLRTGTDVAGGSLDGGLSDDVAGGVADRIQSRIGGGAPLSPELHGDLQQRFDRPLGPIRVHRDATADSLNTLLNARAFTVGQDIFFSSGSYEPDSADGYKLLAHEVAHTTQQASGSGPGDMAGRLATDRLTVSDPGDRDEQAAQAAAEQVAARRVAVGLGDRAGNAAVARFVQVRRDVHDPTTASINDSWAAALTDAQLQDQIRRVDDAIAHAGDDAAALAAQQGNSRILRAELVRRGLPDGPAIPRPPGLPVDQGFQLIPLDVPADVAAAVPDGQILELGGSAPAGGGAGFGTSSSASPINWSAVAETGGSASGGALIAGNYQVVNYGFAAAGDTSIGLVAIPRIQGPFGSGGWNPAAGLNPNANPLIDVARPLDAWGHTAMILRQNGKITWIRGFGPEMGPGDLPGFAAASGGVGRGTANWPGVVENDASMLKSTMARTIEYPIDPALAEQIAGMHPEGPGGTGGSPANYTARPDVFAAKNGGTTVMCTNQNCVMYAVEQVEGHLGGPVGPVGQGSVVNEGGVGTASQGRLYRLMADAEAGKTTLSQPPGATGPAVLGEMPAGLRYLKWGGRVFLVIGVVAGAAEIITAPEGRQERTAVGVSGGFAGGFALGAAAGLVCGPGAVVCSVVLGLGLGLVGSVAGRSLAEYVYDRETETPAAREARLTDQREADQLHEFNARQGVCPSCHAQLRRSEQAREFDSATLLGTALTGPGGAAGGRERELGPAELEMIRKYLEGH